MNAGWSPVDFRNDIAMIKLDVCIMCHMYN